MLPSLLIYRLAGFFSAFPLFIIPSWYVFYVNRVEKIQFNHVHPDYTYSLGPALPLNLFVLSVVCLIMLKGRKLKIKHNFYQLIFLVIMAVYFLLASQSLKSIAFSASLFSAFILIDFIKIPEGRVFIVNHIRGLLFFVVAHAVSLSLDGYEFSKKTEGISFFSFEIYQSLISYPALVAALFGFIILNPSSFRDILKIENTVLPQKLIILIILFILIYIETFLTRRASFVVIGFSLFLFVIGRLYDHVGGRKAFVFASLILISFVAFIRSTLFSGLKSFDIENMILPRLNLYKKVIYELLSDDPILMIFGHKNDWAIHHNTFLDILAHSGLVGVLLFIICIIVIFKKYKNTVNSFLNKNSDLNLVLILFTFCLGFDNFINCALSTPYYSVSFFIIFTGVLFLNTDRELSE